MSKARINCRGTIDTLAHGATVKGYVQDELIGKDIFEIHNLNYGENEVGEIEFGFDIRFNNNADRDAIKSWIQDQVENHPVVKTWFSSFKISTHRCTHDDEQIEDCTTTDYFEWARA